MASSNPSNPHHLCLVTGCFEESRMFQMFSRAEFFNILLVSSIVWMSALESLKMNSSFCFADNFEGLLIPCSLAGWTLDL
jgi:hypothetical protein